MPGSPVPYGSTVLCSHGGHATATTPNSRVAVGGRPTVFQQAPWMIAGCVLPPLPAANGPCSTARWLTGSTRVLSLGQPLVIAPAASIAAPSGAALIPVAPFLRVVMT